MADTDQPLPTSTPPPPKSAPHGIADKIHVLIRNRQKIIYEDDVKSLSSKNDTGTFDVLPEHANFITLINQTVTVRKLDSSEEVFKFENGLMKVKDNVVHCYMDLLSAAAVLPEEKK